MIQGSGSGIRKIVFYVAIGLMVPTLVIAIFFRQKYPVLGPAMAILGIGLLGLVSFMDYRRKRGK